METHACWQGAVFFKFVLITADSAVSRAQAENLTTEKYPSQPIRPIPDGTAARYWMGTVHSTLPLGPKSERRSFPTTCRQGGLLERYSPCLQRDVRPREFSSSKEEWTTKSNMREKECVDNSEKCIQKTQDLFRKAFVRCIEIVSRQQVLVT